MTPAAALEYRDYLRLDMMPHILCPGCGHGVVLKAVLRAIHGLGLRREDVVFVSGIGCSSRIVGYVDFCTLHTTHGRPLTFASGIKLARPDLHVVVITGDGDGLAIGGNHLIHAARRNIDLTCLLLNNATYGMTGGQGAPTTRPGSRSSTMPGGTIEPEFDACRLVQGAGGTFVARGMTASPLGLDALIARALGHRGVDVAVEGGKVEAVVADGAVADGDSRHGAPGQQDGDEKPAAPRHHGLPRRAGVARWWRPGSRRRSRCRC